MRATTGSTEGMVRLDGGFFLMGNESPDIFPYDGEGPVRRVRVDPFYASRFAVTNEQFDEFVRRTGYVSDAERFGWSLVFQNHLAPEERGVAVPGTPWWLRVEGATWAHPEGPDSGIHNRLHYPVVQVSWNDARRYCEWAGVRLPTEAEWEYASRGGLEQKKFPWGDELTPGGRHMCNVWQGRFPDIDLAEDGYAAPAPVNAFQPNGFGLYNTVGNTWEWCSDYFDAEWRRAATTENPVGPPEGTMRVLKGGSYLCHESYCYRYRNAARTSNTPDSGTTHMSFRVVRDL